MSQSTGPYSTLCLDQTTWDLFADASGNIAVASPPYAVAQDVATACRTFVGDVYYNTLDGVPYFQDILGQFPPLQLVKAQLEAAALTVPNVSNPVFYAAALNDRVLTGQIQFVESSSGAIQTVNVNVPIVNQGT